MVGVQGVGSSVDLGWPRLSTETLLLCGCRWWECRRVGWSSLKWWLTGPNLGAVWMSKVVRCRVTCQNVEWACRSHECRGVGLSVNLGWPRLSTETLVLCGCRWWECSWLQVAKWVAANCRVDKGARKIPPLNISCRGESGQWADSAVEPALRADSAAQRSQGGCGRAEHEGKPFP